ncbi:unnamed protein product [Adineta steineri]|uniref:Uncharacterized protein n=1 Tax=Adineta steineri TaxID=433720 RepID=A0A818LYF4_9BILA|nr:unnamed protein product [Adineta steineri]CAF3572365.1 unnamed protein product [Adineta steineri]
MSRSVFRTTNEIQTTTDRRFFDGPVPINRSNETVSMIVQSSPTKLTNKSIARNNPRIKRNLRDKRRSTGIRPNDVSLASTSTEGSANDDDEEEKNTLTYVTEPIESCDHNRNLSSPKSIFAINRVQSSFENLSIPRTDSYNKSTSSTIYPSTTTKMFRPQEFILCRVEKQTSDDEKYRQVEEHIHALESLVHDKDSIIYDLQRKLDKMTHDLNDAEQQIYLLNQDKLTLIKAFTTLQDDKSTSGDIPKRSNFITRN